MDDYFKEKFGDDIAYRVCNPQIRDQFLATINRLYDVRQRLDEHSNRHEQQHQSRRRDQVGHSRSEHQQQPRFPGAQPCSILRKDLQHLAQQHYVVAQKTDGTRYLLLLVRVGDQQFCVMCDRKVSMWLVDLQFTPEVYLNETLFDGELVHNEVENRYMFEIFDLVSSGQKSRSTDSYIARMNNARDIVEQSLKTQPQSFQIKVKRYWPTHKIDQLTSSVRMHQGCRCDGLVFTPVKLFVKPYRNNYMFKWKDQHTIDPLVRYNAAASKTITVNSTSAPPVAVDSGNHSVKNSDDDITQPPKRIRRTTTVPKTAKTIAATTTFGKSDTNDEQTSQSKKPFDIDSFELWLKNTDDQLVFFRRVNVALNRGFLEQHGLTIVGTDSIVECEYDMAAQDWRLGFIRKDRDTPNTEYTVSKTLENINENITLEEIVQVSLQNRPLNNNNNNHRSATTTSTSHSREWKSPFAHYSDPHYSESGPTATDNNITCNNTPYSPSTFIPPTYGGYTSHNCFIAPGYEPRMPPDWQQQPTSQSTPQTYPAVCQQLPRTMSSNQQCNRPSDRQVHASNLHQQQQFNSIANVAQQGSYSNHNTLTAAEANRQRLEEQQRARLAAQRMHKSRGARQAPLESIDNRASIARNVISANVQATSTNNQPSTYGSYEEYDPCTNCTYDNNRSTPVPLCDVPQRDIASLLTALNDNLRRNPQVGGPLSSSNV